MAVALLCESEFGPDSELCISKSDCVGRCHLDGYAKFLTNEHAHTEGDSIEARDCVVIDEDQLLFPRGPKDFALKFFNKHWVCRIPACSGTVLAIVEHFLVFRSMHRCAPFHSESQVEVGFVDVDYASAVEAYIRGVLEQYRVGYCLPTFVGVSAFEDVVQQPDLEGEQFTLVEVQFVSLFAKLWCRIIISCVGRE